MSDTSAIEAIVDEIIANNAPQVEQFKSGNEKILGFFVGQAMKATQGKANPKLLNEMLRTKLG
jgi:aspartyl-tRNA(Asn)/glutamyl-tRNA(Gln) amidotransferase subunit B